jgi:hypothetical protein
MELEKASEAVSWVEEVLATSAFKTDDGKIDVLEAWTVTPPDRRDRVIEGLETIFEHPHHAPDPIPVLTQLLQWRKWTKLIFYTLPLVFAQACVGAANEAAVRVAMLFWRWVV